MGVQMFVTQVLRNQGYQVLAAADMQEAQHVSNACPTDIHLILTDIILPTSNGMALAQALVAKRPGTPVLYMSGAGSDAIQRDSIRGRARWRIPREAVPSRCAGEKGSSEYCSRPRRSPVRNPS